MKATIDIPDDLYRHVKARTALEGRPLRAVAIELFEGYVRSADTIPGLRNLGPDEEEIRRFPWLAIGYRHGNPARDSGMESIRASIARGWAAESGEPVASER